GKHLFGALLAGDDPALDEALHRAGVDREGLSRSLPAFPRVASDPRVREIPLSEGVRQVIQFAGREAARDGRAHVTSVDLLLGLLAGDNPWVLAALERSGSSSDELREAARAIPVPARDRSASRLGVGRLSARQLGVARWLVITTTLA